MAEFKYDKKHLLEQTNCGLDVILHYYPQAERNGKFEHFKLNFREERTPSAKVAPLQSNSDCYYIKDFGSGESYSCFDLVMQEEGIDDFGEACKFIASTMNIDGLNVTFGQAKLEFLDAEPGQKHGDYFFDYKNEPSEEDLRVLGALVKSGDLSRLGFRALNSFTQVKKYPKNHKNEKNRGKTIQIVTKSTERYPIFVLECDGFKKIYQPLNKDKGFRFRYVGQKPEHYLVGLAQMEREYNEALKGSLDGSSVADNFGVVDETDESDEKKADGDARFDCVLIASGERDALNISSLGYPVVWKNSESEPLTYENWTRLTDIAKKVVNVPDLDSTGVQKGIELALQHIDIYTLWLPKWIKKHSYRGKPCNDMTDFCKIMFNRSGEGALRSMFSKLVKTSFPTRFWNKVYKSNGDFKKYTFNSEACYRFLNYNGFYRIKEKHSKEDHTFIRIKNNIVERIDVDDIKNYPGDWVRAKMYPNSLLNYIHDTNKLTEKKLAKIEVKKPNTVQYGADFQRLFFKNKVWTVTKDKILQTSYKQLDNEVWRDKIIDKSVKLNKSKAFKITKNDDVFDIEIKAKNNHFLNYLINTSRVHWKVLGNAPFEDKISKIDANLSPLEKKEARKRILEERRAYREANQFNIAEENLSPKLVSEQKMHLINKIYAIGYLLHRYKREDRPWAVFAMDHKISDISESNGGSGKSILLAKAIPQIVKAFEPVSANDPEIYRDKYMLGNVTPDTDYVIFDDADSHFPMRKVFTNITGSFAVRAPYVQNFYIPFDKSPKIAFTSNFGIWGLDESTERRLLYTSFSDYYHHNGDDHFETWTARNDFGKNLITDFDDAEYSDFVNLMAECLQFYLSCEEKINPPMDNIDKRNEKQTMGDAFLDWADVYFNDKLNFETPKNAAFEDFKEKTKLNKTTPQRFKRSLKSWCKYHGYVFNPKDKCDGSGRIMSRYNGETTEMIYIRGVGEAARNNDDDGDSLIDDLPY